MAEMSLFQRQRTMLRDLVAMVEKRGRLEVEIEQGYQADARAFDEAYRTQRQETIARFESDRHAAEREFRLEEQRIKTEFETRYAKTERTYRSELATLAEKAEHNERETAKALQEALWLADTVYEATEQQPMEQFVNARKAADGRLEELENIEHAAADLLRRSRMRAPTSPEPVAEPIEDAAAALLERVDRAQQNLDQLRRLFLPKIFRSAWPVVWLIALGAATFAAGWLLTDWHAGRPLGLLVMVSVGGPLLLLALLFVIARLQIRRLYTPIARARAEAPDLAIASIKAAECIREQQRETLRVKRDADLQAARDRYEPVLVEIENRRKHYFDRLNEKYPALLQRMKVQREEDLFRLRETHLQRLTSLEENQKTDLDALQTQHDTRSTQRKERYEREWAALEKEWNTGMATAYATAAEMTTRSEAIFRPWHDPAWTEWTPPSEFAAFVRFGSLHVDVERLPGGLPKDARLLMAGASSFDLPALLAFPEPVSMLIEAGENGRETAIAALQTVMFRLLTTLPPGKVRFTIIDPVGLGQNFAGFMHLADYEGAFVTDKIWTEDRHIEQRLLDLTEHMENVIQKYLRNEYETIADYNVDAGEIAEPYRFLVIANFPVNFSETAARRLASIVNSGSRCGVYTLITADTRQPMPQGVSMNDLVKNGVRLKAAGAGTPGFIWLDDDLQRFPLSIDAPPDEDLLTSKLHLIGQAAKDSTRVEVPFEVIAPAASELWSRRTTNDVTVALGRAGATKLQHLTLGVGTSQHALVAGKTGSGKSTLLHALITNLSLWYSPEEIEFYLVDFKKGVEFKTYATHNLPHARAVAIESDREFGLSVLQRLDAELKHRGNIFRDLGVQDMAGYRRARERQGDEETKRRSESAPVGGAKDTSSLSLSVSSSLPSLPRILLIVDEFQELFTEDDKLAQDSALLMDRLVRQGRAFGMHVLLGSQTLGGAYSLARSTIGQMGVRIALQCSEADSYLILSDDNAAARLLSRPGEAIYNDASGMVEGNNPFQIVWLPDGKREKYLQQIAALAERARYRRPEPQIVFEGNVPADIARNHLLRDLIESDAWPAAKTQASAWLGEAIAIKDPTAAVFRRQSGANLIIVGQRDDAALAMMATSIISLAAQHPPAARGAPPTSPARREETEDETAAPPVTAAGETAALPATFYVFDGTPADSSDGAHGYLGHILSMLPHRTQNVAWRDVASAINTIAVELQRRQDEHIHDAPAIYLFIHGLQRYRMLRQDEDFGFSMSSDADAPPRPEKQFANILREGPAHGIHTLAWCDTVNNLNRSLDRQGLREFEIRVLFQMGAADSSNLVDSPLAAKLGLHRALFFSEELGTLEKFRPYALPDEGWLRSASAALRRAQ